MRIITCASYYGTGSSAVTDFFSEFSQIHSLGDYEYRFLQDPDGIADLEYNIVENNHRHNTSDAIKRFLRFMHANKVQGYGGYDIFGNSLEELTNRYVEELTELKALAWWNKDRVDRGRLFGMIDRFYSLYKRFITGNLHSERKFSLLQKSEYGYFTAISEEQFLRATRRYVHDLLASACPEEPDFLMVDQMVPPTNTKRYLRYFDDAKIIVVDRDPRDIYLLEKLVWQWGVIPVRTAEEFVKWFKITRKYVNASEEDHDKVLRIHFEDMIYDYDNTAQRLMDFIGIDPKDHVRPFTAFNPDISIRNTRLYKRVKGHDDEIRLIESELKDFIVPESFYDK